MNLITACPSLARLTMGLVAAAAAAAAQAQATSDPAAVPPTPAADPSSPSYGSTPPAAARTTSQTGSTWGNTLDGGTEYSLLPYTRRGYMGLNLGQSDYGELQCGAGGFSCDDKKVGGTLYTGGMFNDWLGVELGYLHMGRVDRAGGRTQAQGLNVSLVGRLPLQQFNVFAKGGTTYGRTKVSSDPLSLVPAGKDSGWGASYGAGVGMDVTPTTSVVLEWARHDFHFEGVGKQEVDLTSLGVKYRF
jgi:OmpA-OmpF porin, OOP family